MSARWPLPFACPAPSSDRSWPASSATGRGGKSPSLRRHLQLGGGPSEVGWLNGAVADAARRLGQRAPVNTRLAEIVAECSGDAGRWAGFRGRPERLLAELAAT